MKPMTGGSGGSPAAKPALPVWSIPLLLAVVGIILAVGRLSLAVGVLVAAETILFCAYLLWRARRHPDVPRPTSNLIALFPGHLLLLLAVVLLPDPDRLALLWAIVPAASVAYDLISLREWRRDLRASTLIGLYAILWAALFTLLNRVIAIGRGFGEREEILAAVAFGVFGGLFISVGAFRHWRADKE
jgi:hypothetical protein